MTGAGGKGGVRQNIIILQKGERKTMLRLKNATLALAACLLATGALAQHAAMFVQTSDSDDGDATATPAVAPTSSVPTVAAELFGASAVDLEFGENFQPVYRLKFVAARLARTDTDGDGDIDGDDSPAALDTDRAVGGSGAADQDEGAITYTLSGAVFDERVSPNDFSITTGAATASVGTVEIESGGAKGDSSVTISVTATDTWTDQTNLTFTMPDLSATPGRTAAGMVNPVRMNSSYSLTKQSHFPEGMPMNKACGEMNADGTQASARGCKIVMASNYIESLTLSADVMGNIDLADRAKLISGTKHIADIAIGTVSIKASDGAILDQDGDPVTFSGDLSGDVAITVTSSQFRDGDIVYIDDNADKAPNDRREEFSISGDKATADRALPTPSEGTPMASWSVMYRPNGKDELMHGTKFVVTAATDFSDRDNMNRHAGTHPRYSITTTLNLNGIKPNPPKAYAIAPLSNTDRSNMRITCESPKACNVFLSCNDDMGMSYFGDAGFMVPGNGTKRLDQTMVGMELGMAEDESWSGRLACEALSTAPISVQVLTRAAGVLVNNTYVGEGGQ